MRCIVLSILALALSAPVSALAVPTLEITDGSIVLVGPPGVAGYDLQGEGFRINGSGGFPIVEPIRAVGQTFFSLSGPYEMSGDPTPEGAVFGSRPLGDSLLFISGGVPVPQDPPVGFFSSTGLFTASGQLNAFAPPEERFDIFGGGTVEAEFLRRQANPSQFELVNAHFDFAPVPEPGTLLLVGSGAVGTWLRRRRSR